MAENRGTWTRLVEHRQDAFATFGGSLKEGKGEIALSLFGVGKDDLVRFYCFPEILTVSMSSLPPCKAPEIIMTDIVFPGDANTRGTMFGGKALALMDKAAFLASVRYAHVPFVTVSTDGTRFLEPVQVGDIIETRAKVSFVGRTSLVVKVELYRELPYEVDSRVLATRDWFAMAARDKEGKPLALPPLLIETEQEKADEYLARQFRDRSKGMS